MNPDIESVKKNLEQIAKNVRKIRDTVMLMPYEISILMIMTILATLLFLR
jgi:hypothetical protein